MPALSPTQLTDLRTPFHSLNAYISALQPRVLWTARVNDASPDRGQVIIDFDGGAGSNFSWIEALQTIWVGSVAGGNDVGRVRIKSITSGDGGVTGQIVLGNNELAWSDNNYLTFYHNYELWAVFPFIDSNEIFYKDGDIAYTDQNFNLDPIAIAGPHQATFLTGASIIFQIPIGLSYTLDPAATLVSYAVSVLPSAGVTVGAIVGNNIPVTITAVGQYWVKATVTDSNGKTMSTYRSLFVHSTDRNSSDFPFFDFDTASLSGQWESGGYELTINAEADCSLLQIPDETLAVLWAVQYFDGQQIDVSLFDVGTNILFTGYLRRDRVESNLSTGGSVEFSFNSINYLLATREIFSISLTSINTPTTWYEYRNGYLTTGRILHHLYRWHSTLLNICDFLLLNNDSNIQRQAIDLDKGDLLRMGDGFARDKGIKAHIVCDKQGKLYMARDLVLRNDTDRAAAVVVAPFVPQDMTPPLTIVREPQTKVSFVFASGLSYNGTDVAPLGATSPSIWQSPFGSSEVHLEGQMFTTQLQANQLSGQIFSTQNNEYPEIRVNLHGNYWGVLETALMEWWQFNVNAPDSPRQIVLIDQNAICRTINASLNFQAGTISVNATFEPETDGTDGVPYQWPTDAPIAGGGDEPVPTEETSAIATAASLLYLPNVDGALWETRTADPINYADVDPWWTLKTIPAGDFLTPNESIVFRCGEGELKRSYDGGQTWENLAPGDPPNDAGDAPAPTAGDVSYIQYEGSLIYMDTHLFLVRWQNGGGDWRSWLLYSDDDCATFSWLSLGAGGGGGPAGFGVGNFLTTNGYINDAFGSISADADIKCIVSISSTKILVSYLTTGNGYCVVGDVVGTVVTFGTPVLFATSCDTSSAVLLSSTKFALTYMRTTPSRDLFAVVGDITGGSTITLGTERSILSGSLSGAIYALQINAFSAATILLTWNYGGGVLTPGGGAVAVSVSGNTLPAQGAIADFDVSSPQLLGRVDTIMMDSTHAVIAYGRRTGIFPDFSAYALVLSVSGLAITLGTPTLIEAGDFIGMSISRLSSSQIIYTYADISVSPTSLFLRTCNVNTGSLTISPNTATEIVAPTDHEYDLQGIFLSSSVSVGVIYTDTDLIGGDQFIVAEIFDVPSFTSSAQYVGPVPDSVLNDVSTCVLSSSAAAIVYRTDPSNDGEVAILQIGGMGDTKALGISASKGGGAYVYATMWDQIGELALQRILLPDLIIELDTSLGLASEAQLLAKTFWAYPFAPMGDDNACFIFGRLNDAAVLGTTQIIFTDDAGTTFFVVENGWATNHCGAMTQNNSLDIVAIRNAGTTSSKIYLGAESGSSTSLALIVSLPMPASVNPGSLKCNLDNDLIVGAGRAQGIMVLRAQYPYNVWSNITANHQTANPINTVIVFDTGDV